MGSLTLEQERQIEHLRGKDLGYRVIANELGLSRDTVRNYCRKQGLLADTPSDSDKAPALRECRQCGKALPLESASHRRFCSDACRWRWWNTHAPSTERPMKSREEITCTYCGKAFIAYRNQGRRYCSHQCYIRDRFWRMEDGREPYISPSKK